MEFSAKYLRGISQNSEEEKKRASAVEGQMNGIKESCIKEASNGYQSVIYTGELFPEVINTLRFLSMRVLSLNTKTWEISWK